ncbi:MAG: ComEC/Rec2 family competence protein [Gemmataceae bacterium]|nr:ComEC/Rec2 family competence protein [Gemmataceae bacterium]MCI0740406.1 ComEC/Rec2 family competence protein [Gemmataceae bacterium]
MHASRRLLREVLRTFFFDSIGHSVYHASAFFLDPPQLPPMASTAQATPATGNFWRAPLVPIALAATAGIVLDWHLCIPLGWSLGAILACVAAWAVHAPTKQQRLAVFYLRLAFLFAGAAYHQWRQHYFDAGDMRHFVAVDPTPARLRGTVESEPAQTRGISNDPLRTFASQDSSRFVLGVTEWRKHGEWQPASGRVQVQIERALQGYHVGDRLELVGLLALPRGPANPGEFDHAEHLRDQGIGATLQVPDAPDALILVERGWPGSLFGWLGWARAWSEKRIAELLPESTRGLAQALLLGSETQLDKNEWDAFFRTGVVHVLAISGQHLMVLAAFLWYTLRLAGLRRKARALTIAILLLGYALLTGGRPPVMRAAWVVAAYTGAVLLRRPPWHANAFALAWLGIAAENPASIFNTGCQLSFLAVAVLFWVTPMRESDPDEQALGGVIRDSRHRIINAAVDAVTFLGKIYFLNLAVWLAIAPLVADRFHVLSPAALLIGPPVVLLGSLALISGMLLLLLAPLGLGILFACPTHALLKASSVLVHQSGDWASAWYVPGMPNAFLWLFYFALIPVLTWNFLRFRVWLSSGILLLGCSIGVALALWPQRTSTFACTFLAVGHGGCVVIETASGEVLVYDAGAMSGPDVTRRTIAPFLWQAGHRRIDVLFLSHADLDHYNGVKGVLERFGVSKAYVTHSFRERLSPGAQLTAAELDRRGTPVEVLRRGDTLSFGDLTLEILHPPQVGPDGNENARSLVIHLRTQDVSFLLTGDLEGPGLEQLLRQEPRPVDVLMAPHHGSKAANVPALAGWARPKVVVSSQGPPRGYAPRPNVYEERGARYFTTWGQGAIAFRKEAGNWTAETFLSQRRWLWK